MGETRLIRLHSRDPAKGHLMQTYGLNLGKTSAKFVAGTWYTVSSDIADYLAGIHARPDARSGPMAFDVCATEAEAMLLVKREREEAERGQKPEDAVAMAHDFSTLDLPKPAARVNSAVAPSEAELRGEAPPPADLSDLDDDDTAKKNGEREPAPAARAKPEKPPAPKAPRGRK